MMQRSRSSRTRRRGTRPAYVDDEVVHMALLLLAAMEVLLDNLVE